MKFKGNSLILGVFFVALLLAEATHAQMEGATTVYVDNADPFDSERNENATVLGDSTDTDLAPSGPTDVIGFEWKGTTFSTGVNDARLNDESISFEPTSFRALPINDVQTSSSANYIAGLEASVDPDQNIYNSSPEQSVVAALLTDGQRGLDFTSGIYNHPLRVPANTFVLSSGIDGLAWNDDEPDILFAQLGGSSTEVPLILIDSSDNELGRLDVNALRDDRPEWVVGEVNQDFFTIGSFSNNVPSPQPRTIQLFAADISEFSGLTQAELADADRFQIEFNGEIDFAFLAVNEGVIASASALKTEQEPNACDSGTNVLTPAPIVQVVDSDGNPVKQPGIAVRAEDADPDDGLDVTGATEETTDNDGKATFNNLKITPCPTDATQIKFTFALDAEGLDAAAPDAVDDTATVPEGGSVSIDVLSNDSFGGDGPATGTITILTNAANGSATVDNGNTPNDPTDDRIDYVPDTGFSGSDSFEYQIEDSKGDTDSATVVVTITPDPIKLAPESGFSITWDGNDGVNFNGTVPDNLALSGPNATPFASTVFGSPHTIAGLNDGQYGNSFSWLAATTDTDPHAGVTFSGGVQIDAIAFGRDNTGDFSDRHDGTYTLQFTTDLGASRTWTSLGEIDLAFQDEVAAADKDTVPGGEYTGWLRHEFGVQEGGGPLVATGIRLLVPTSADNNTGDVVIDELEIFGNAIPVFNDGASTSLTLNEDAGAISINDLLDVTDADTNQTLSWSVTTAPSSGVLGGFPFDATANGSSVTPTGLTYKPNLHANGADSFVIEVNDGSGGMDSITVNVTITPVNDPAIANNASATTDEDIPVTIALSGSDVDGDALGFVIASGPSNGSLGTVSSTGPTTSQVAYTPAADFNGSDSFTYRANDGMVDSALAAVDITINAVNDTPSFTATNPPAVGEDAGAQSLAGWASGFDPGGGSDEASQSVQAYLVSEISDATLFAAGPSVDTNGDLTYTPADDANGTATFDVAVQDDGGTGNGGSDTSVTQSFTITVNAVNDAPDAVADSATTNEDESVVIDVLANDSDVDGNLDSATVQVVSGPSDGATTVNATNGEITYTPNANFNGSDSFDYKVCDDGTPTPPKCGQTTVSISVGSVNDLPSASDDALTVVAGNTATADVLANDDFGGDGPGTGAITIGTAPSDGMASVDDGGTPGDPTDDRIAYTPDSGFTGSDSLVYAITDANGDTATATLAITVESADAGAPAASDDVLTVAADNTATTDVLANDTFGSDGPGTGAIEIITAPSDGTASVDNGGTPDDPTDDRIDYTPDAGFAGSDTLVYRIADADGDTAEATVSVTVNDTASGSPAAGDDVADVDEDDSVVIAVLANDDFGGDGAGTTAAEIIGGADNGTATVDDGGTPSDPTDDTVAYEPADDFFGTDAFDYRITDADGDTARATVQVSVKPVNDAPAITLSGDQLSDSGSGEQVVSNFAANFEPGPDESEQSIAEFIVSNDDNALFAAQPAIATDGTLSYTPNDANLEGIAEVTVQVRDDGGTDNGGQDLSQPQTFTISIGVSADVEISVTGPANAAAGSEVTYTVNVTNNGPSQAEGVVVSVDVPDSVTFVSAEPPCSSGFPCSIGGLTASSTAAAGGSLKQPGLQAIDVGQVVEFDATFRLGSSLGGNEQLSWNITSDSGDPNPGNDDDQSILGVAALPVPVLGRTGLLLLCLMLALAAIVATRRCSIQVG